MAAHRERTTGKLTEQNRKDTYIDGNVVRKYAATALPEKKPERITTPRTTRRPVHDWQVREERLPGIRRQIDFAGAAILITAMVVVIYLAIQYMQVSAEVYEVSKANSSLEDTLSSLSDSNENKLDAIAADINLNDVYQIAVGELGMVYPNHNEVITYTYNAEGYVRQYAAIPAMEEEETSVLRSVLDKILR